MGKNKIHGTTKSKYVEIATWSVKRVLKKNSVPLNALNSKIYQGANIGYNFKVVIAVNGRLRSQDTRNVV